MLVAAGSGLATLSLPGSQGVPKQAVENTLIAEYNDLESVENHIEQYPDIAAVILEPVTGNMGVIEPSQDFIQGLRKLTKEKNILLICDEVMTGFRSKFGGAQEMLGIEADITCLGKVIGGGFPVGAYGARNEIMENVAPLGGMYQAGTLSGNPIAMAAGMATLLELKKQNPYKKFDKIAEKIETILLNAGKKYGVDLTVNRFGSMISPFFAKEKIANFTDAQKCDTKKFATFFWNMIENGVFLPPSQFESWFLCSAVTHSDMRKFERAVDLSIAAVAKQH